jgi:predicted metal-dependent hydrolase
MKELASGPRLPNGELDDRLRDFRDNRVGILLCIIFTMTNRECSLAEAREIVINSIAWIDQRDAFLQEQEAKLKSSSKVTLIASKVFSRRCRQTERREMFT